MKKNILTFLTTSAFILIYGLSVAQETPDTTDLDYQEPEVMEDPEYTDTETYYEVDYDDPPKSRIIQDIDWEDMGVSIAPSSMHLAVKPGTSQVRDITVKNVTREKYSFRVDFSDFEMTPEGKPGPPDPDHSRYSLSRYIGINPSYFELGPGEEMKVRATISMPDEETSYTAKWTIITIEQVVERPMLDPGDSPERLSMGVITTFGFGVYVYQNPPNVIINQIDLERMEYVDAPNRRVIMEVKNSGDGISYCRSYLELTNLNTGEQTRLRERNFTILPQFNREFKFDLQNLPSGRYSAIGVIDYGSRDEILAAEVEFEI